MSTSSHAQQLKNIVSYLDERVSGQSQVVELCLASVLAGGHLLLEGPPGVGKTTLARGIAEVFQGEFSRIQMTSDLLPSDILGFLRPASEGRELEFRKGPIFCNFLLADELNRSSPKTQSALLEAMAESHVTIDGKKHALPKPFFVIATQNPVESHGVFPLADSELDRFTMLIEMGLPSAEQETAIYLRQLAGAKNTISDLKVDALNLNLLSQLQESVNQVTVEQSVFNYFYEIVKQTRNHAEIASGASVRGALLYLAAARSMALLRGRTFVTPQDLRDLAVPVLAHRVSLVQEGAGFVGKRRIIEQILSQAPAPR